MRWFIMSALVAVLVDQCFGQLAGVPKCSVAEAKQFAMCVAQPMAMNLNITFVTDLPTANSYCRQARASISCIKTFSAKCLTDLPKQATNLLNYGIKKHIRNVCKTQQSRRELGKKLKCNNPVMSKLDSCMVAFIDKYRRVPFMSTKEKMTGLCCGYYDFLGNVLTESKKVCSESDSDYLRTFIDSFASDILDVLCSSVSQNLAVCENIQYPAKTIEDEPSVSFLPPLLNVLSNL